MLKSQTFALIYFRLAREVTDFRPASGVASTQGLLRFQVMSYHSSYLVIDVSVMAVAIVWHDGYARTGTV